MKRRLTKAFDRMTMPQECSDRIERMLEAELEANAKLRKAGRFTEKNMVRQRAEPDRPWKGIGAVAASLALLVTLGFLGYRQILLNKVIVQPAATSTWETQAANTEQTSEATEGETPEVLVSGEYQYHENEDGTVTITKYTGSEENLWILPFVDGKLVTAIGSDPRTGEGAFTNCDAVKSVVIPDSVTLLGDNAFQSCRNLEMVTVPASVAGLGHCVFDDCGKLRSVYFQGDAPAAGNYVFTASDQLTLYYREGTQGWTNPWYGCNTQSAASGSQAGVAENVVLAEFIGVLQGNRRFHSYDYGKEMTIAEYCQTWAEAAEITVDVPKFAVVDMDGDGVNEVVLWLRVNEISDYGTIVLRYQDGKIWGQTFTYRQLCNLRINGIFDYSGGADYDGSAKLVFTKFDFYSEDVFVPAEEPGQNVWWHCYPCERVDIVLASYQNAGQNRRGGITATYHYYDIFRGLILGRHTDSWELLCTMMEQNGYDWNLSEGILTAFFPDVPGCMLTAYPAENDQVGELGYYLCTEDQEYEARATGLNGDEPQYFIDDLWGMGTEVESLAEVDAYFQDYWEMAGELENLLALTTAELFSNAYFTADTQTMQRHLVEDYPKRLETYSGSPDFQVTDIKGVPEEALQDGDRVTVWVEFRETPDTDSYTYLTLEMVKLEGNWKVASYTLEK